MSLFPQAPIQVSQRYVFILVDFLLKTNQMIICSSFRAKNIAHLLHATHMYIVIRQSAEFAKAPISSNSPNSSGQFRQIRQFRQSAKFAKAPNSPKRRIRQRANFAKAPIQVNAMYLVWSIFLWNQNHKQQ